MYFRQFWQDPRLSFERREGLEKLVVGAEYINLIWVPDTFFVNEKTAYFHKATTENQFLRILHTGEILRSIRYGIVIIWYGMPCVQQVIALVCYVSVLLFSNWNISDEQRSVHLFCFDDTHEKEENISHKRL